MLWICRFEGSEARTPPPTQASCLLLVRFRGRLRVRIGLDVRLGDRLGFRIRLDLGGRCRRSLRRRHRLCLRGGWGFLRDVGAAHGLEGQACAAVLAFAFLDRACRERELAFRQRGFRGSPSCPCPCAPVGGIFLGGLRGEVGVARRVQADPDPDRLNRGAGSERGATDRVRGALPPAKASTLELNRFGVTAPASAFTAGAASSSSGTGPRRSQITARMFGGDCRPKPGGPSSVGPPVADALLKAAVEQLGRLHGPLVGGGRAEHDRDQPASRHGSRWPRR